MNINNSLDNILLKIINEEIENAILQEKGAKAGQAIDSLTTILEKFFLWGRTSVARIKGSTEAFRGVFKNMASSLQGVNNLNDVSTISRNYLQSIRGLEKIFRGFSKAEKSIMDPKNKVLESFVSVTEIGTLDAMDKALKAGSALHRNKDIQNVLNLNFKQLEAAANNPAVQRIRSIAANQKQLITSQEEWATVSRTIGEQLKAADNIYNNKAYKSALAAADAAETRLFGSSASYVEAASQGTVRQTTVNSYRTLAATSGQQLGVGRIIDIFHVKLVTAGSLLGYTGLQTYDYLQTDKEPEVVPTDDQIDNGKPNAPLLDRLKDRLKSRAGGEPPAAAPEAPPQSQVAPPPPKTEQQKVQDWVDGLEEDSKALWTSNFNPKACDANSCGNGYLVADKSKDFFCDHINSAGASIGTNGGYRNMLQIFNDLIKAKAITAQEIMSTDGSNPCETFGEAIETLQRKAKNNEYLNMGTTKADAEKLRYRRRKQLQESGFLKYDPKTGKMIIKEETEEVVVDGIFGSRTRDFLLKIRAGQVKEKSQVRSKAQPREEPRSSTNTSKGTSLSSNNKPEDWMNALMDSRQSATDLNTGRSGLMKPRIHLRFDVYSMEGSQMNPILRELTNTRMQLEERAIQLLLQTGELNVTVGEKVVPFNIDHAKEIGMAMLTKIKGDIKDSKRLKYLQPEVLGYRAVLYQNKKDTSNRFENKIELEKLKNMDWSWLGSEATGLMDRSTKPEVGSRGGAMPSILRNLHAPGLNVEINSNNREYAPWWQMIASAFILSKDVADFADVNQILTRLEENLKEIKLYATEVSERTGQGKGYQTTNSFRIQYKIFEPILGPELGKIEEGTMRLDDTGETRRLGRQGKANFFFDKQFLTNPNVKNGVLGRGSRIPDDRVKQINTMLSRRAQKLQLPIGRNEKEKLLIPIYNKYDFTRTNIYVDPNSKFEGAIIGKDNAEIYQSSLSTLSDPKGIKKLESSGNDRNLALLLKALAKRMVNRPTADSMAFTGAQSLDGQGPKP